MAWEGDGKDLRRAHAHRGRAEWNFVGLERTVDDVQRTGSVRVVLQLKHTGVVRSSVLMVLERNFVRLKPKVDVLCSVLPVLVWTFGELKLTVDTPCGVLMLLEFLLLPAGVRCAGFVSGALRRVRILTVLLRVCESHVTRVHRVNSTLHDNMCVTHCARPTACHSRTRVINDLHDAMARATYKFKHEFVGLRLLENVVCVGTEEQSRRVYTLGLGLGDHSKVLFQLGTNWHRTFEGPQKICVVRRGRVAPAQPAMRQRWWELGDDVK